MPLEAGTLQGYDQLVAISQEAIQAQLEVLYNTEIDPPLQNGPKYLINHEMHFHEQKMSSKTKKMITLKKGIDAYICCPRVEFGGISVTDETDKYRVAVIRFKFRAAEEWEISDEEARQGRQKNSIFIYEDKDEDDEGNEISIYPEVNINDWEISWEAQIDKKNIQNVFAEIIQPAQSPDSNIAVPKKLQQGLEAVRAENFQVSTIFCAMQSARLVKSFKVVDKNGNKPRSVLNADGKEVDVGFMIGELENMLVRKFVHGDQVAGPTPDNPFVLGYTVSQKVPDLAAVNPAAAKAGISTPAYFVPKSFRCNLSPSNQYSAGTFNYGILTHRALQPPDFSYSGVPRVVDDGVDGAGRFKENVFTRMKTKAISGAADGALFFCQDIFVNHWIASSVAPLFYLSPDTIARQAADAVEKGYKHLNLRGRMNFSDGKAITRSIERGKSYTMTNTLRSGRKMIAANVADDHTESIKMEYDTKVKVEYDNLYALRDEDEDIKRRLSFTIGSYSHLKLKFYRRLAFQGHVKDFFESIPGAFEAVFEGDFNRKVGGKNVYDDDQWEEAYDFDLYINAKYTMNIGTSAQNRGSFTIENLVEHHEDGNNNLKAYNYGPPSTEAPGVYRTKQFYNWAKAFEGAFDDEKGNLDTIGNDMVKGGHAKLEGALDDLVKSLGTTVILPAGEVFMFKGFSTDENGNVFTTLSYDTPLGGQVQTHGNQSIATSWQVPKKPTPKK
ncbi:hypothetical protein ABW20_dc0108898 [Dactylellina cionopaga]|nr:hypothetical protein ABW20_dc0108898 [Dactylellina cionopaga]